MALSYEHGHEIEYDEELGWFYSDTQEKVYGEDTKPRPCAHCGRICEEEDACLGLLPGVKSACCGHGSRADSFILFANGFEIRGFEIIE